MADEIRKLDETTVPLGVYRTGSKLKSDGKHYGGKAVNANGDVLATYEPDEESPGADAFEFDPEKGKVVPAKAKPKPHAHDEKKTDAK